MPPEQRHYKKIEYLECMRFRNRQVNYKKQRKEIYIHNQTMVNQHKISIVQ